MKKIGIYLLSSIMILLGSTQMVSKAFAKNSLKNFFKSDKSKKNEEKREKAIKKITPSVDKNNSNEIFQNRLNASKANILNKINNIKASSKQTENVTSPVSITFMGDKPTTLYTLSRLIDFQPHPTTESILKNKPVFYNDKYYYFNVTYNEGWKEITESTAVLNSICFTFDVFENGKKIRNVTTPKVDLSSKTIKKGQAIGIAEISPFKFNITVDEVTTTSKGISVLVFKLVLIG